MEVAFDSERRFQLWKYTVSHGQLLLRSNKDEGAFTRIEIYFKNTQFVCLPKSMDGISIKKCSTENNDVPDFLVAFSSTSPWYRIETNNGIGYVSADVMVTHEDTLEFYDPSSLLYGPML